MGIRKSSDVDIFTDSSRQADFPRAVDAVVTALQSHGYAVTSTVRTDTFARLLLTSTMDDVYCNIGPNGMSCPVGVGTAEG